MTDSAAPLGIVAFGGVLPVTLARHLSEQGIPFFIAAAEGITRHEVKQFPHAFYPFLKIGRLLDLLRTAGCQKIVFAGQFYRPTLSSLRFDIGTLRALPIILKARGRGDDTLMRQVSAAFENEGFEVVSFGDIAPQLVAPRGAWGKHRLPIAMEAECFEGLKLAHQIGLYDIGQCIVVDQGRVIAVEAAEGTDLMLERVRLLRGTARYPNPSLSGLLIKTAKPQQHLRDDMPVIGLHTVQLAAQAGLSGIVVKAGKVLCADMPEMIRTADEAGLVLLGLAGDAVAAVPPEPGQ